MQKISKFYIVGSDDIANRKYFSLDEAKAKLQRMAQDYERVYLLELKECMLTEFTKSAAEIVDGPNNVEDVINIYDEGQDQEEPLEPAQEIPHRLRFNEIINGIAAPQLDVGQGVPAQEVVRARR